MRRKTAMSLTLLALSSSAVACQSGPTEREYAVPDTLCGVDVPEELYEPLFPPGSALHSWPSFGDFSEHSGSRYCVLSVDDEEIFRAEAMGYDDYADAISSRGLEMTEEDGTVVPGDHQAIVWPGVAMATVPCTIPGIAGANFIETLTIVLEAEHPGDDEESERVLSELIQPFMAATYDMVACQEHEAETNE